MADAPSPRSRRLVLALLALGFSTNVWVLLSGTNDLLGRFRWGLFDPFGFAPELSLPILCAVALVAGGSVYFLAARANDASRYAVGATLLAIVLLGVFVKMGLVTAQQDGWDRYRYRTLASAHAEFILEAVQLDDLASTVRDYESYVRDAWPPLQRRIFLKQKGPGVIAFFSLVNRIANTSPIESVLGRWTQRAEFRDRIASMPGERRPGRRYQLAEREVYELANTLTLIAVLFPILTFLTVIPLYFLVVELAGFRTALLTCLALPFVPGTTLMVGHLDFGVYPFLFSSAVAAFAIGYRRRSGALVCLAALCFVAYLTMTLAAVAAAALILMYVGFDLVMRLRKSGVSRDDLTRAASMLGLLLVASAALLVFLYWATNFDPITRYSYARSIQADWVIRGTWLGWFVTNLAEYTLAFSFAFSLLAIAAVIGSAVRIAKGAGVSLDPLLLSWGSVMLALSLFGSHHGETNRLWAFLYGLGCAGVGATLCTTFPGRAWLVLIGALGVLLLSRSYLSLI